MERHVYSSYVRMVDLAFFTKPNSVRLLAKIPLLHEDATVKTTKLMIPARMEYQPNQTVLHMDFPQDLIDSRYN